MKTRKSIFIHSMFRAGSTYIFNKFRENENAWAFYEPLHHDLINLRPESLDIWKYDKKTTNIMNHPELRKPHFYEFKFAFHDGEQLPYYNTDFAYREFFHVRDTQAFGNYIGNLIDSVPDGKTPVFQFNRTSLRIDWFKENYPESLNIFLLRNPRDQFESYYQRSPIGKNIFLAINLYIVLFEENARQYLLPKQKKPDFSGNVADDLQICMALSKKMNLQKHYEIFYFLWMQSFMHAEKFADLIIDMDKMNSDDTYVSEIENAIKDFSGIALQFDDYNIKQNTQYSLKNKVFTEIEQKVADDYGFHSDVTYSYPENDSRSFLEKILDIFR